MIDGCPGSEGRPEPEAGGKKRCRIVNKKKKKLLCSKLRSYNKQNATEK